MSWPTAFDSLPPAGRAARQRVVWSRTAWQGFVEAAARRFTLDVATLSPLLEALDELAERRLERSRLYGLADHRDLRLLWLGALIWDGPTGIRAESNARAAVIGWRRPTLQRDLRLTLRAARRHAGDAFRSRSHLPYGFGGDLALASQLWHFGGRGHSPLEPLPYSEDTALALRAALGTDWPPPDELTAERYEDWCAWAVAHSHGRYEPADVELAVSATGRRLRAHARPRTSLAPPLPH